MHVWVLWLYLLIPFSATTIINAYSGEWTCLFAKSSFVAFARVCLDIGYTLDVFCLALLSPMVEMIRCMPLLGGLVSIAEDLVLYVL